MIAELYAEDITANAGAGVDPIDQAIDRLASETRQDNTNKLAAELAAEVEETRKPLEAQKAPRDIWSIRRLHDKKPVSAEVKTEKGNYMVKYDPYRAADSYVNDRYAQGTDTEANEHPGSFARLQVAYAEIVAHMLTWWQLVEEVTDKEGNVVLDAEGNQVIKPWPPTLDNVKLLTMDDLIAILNAVTASQRGEVSGQH